MPFLGEPFLAFFYCIRFNRSWIGGSKIGRLSFALTLLRRKFPGLHSSLLTHLRFWYWLKMSSGSSSIELSAYAMIGSEELFSTAHDWDKRKWEEILFHSLLIFFLLHLVDTIGWFTLLVICPKGLLSGWYFSTDKRIALKWWLTKYLILVFPVWCGLPLSLSASRNSTLRSKRASPVVASWISRIASFRQSLPILHSFLLCLVELFPDSLRAEWGPYLTCFFPSKAK